MQSAPHCTREERWNGSLCDEYGGWDVQRRLDDRGTQQYVFCPLPRDCQARFDICTEQADDPRTCSMKAAVPSEVD